MVRFSSRCSCTKTSFMSYYEILCGGDPVRGGAFAQTLLYRAVQADTQKKMENKGKQYILNIWALGDCKVPSVG